jgi:hypothetical protein
VASEAGIEYKVQYNIVFKADGDIEGSGSSTEGVFTIKGVYNLETGTVAWRQSAASCPVWHNPCTKYGAKVESEFFGEMSNLAVPGPVRITGTFLTDLGRYCAVNLQCPRASEAEITVGLPNLLTARVTRRWKPIKEDDLACSKKKKVQRQWTNTSDTMCIPRDDEEVEDEQ